MFLRKHVLGVFSHVFSFLFFFLWALKRTRSWTNVDAFSKVRHTSTGFPKRCNRILISDKDIFKTHLREVYIMMILCDTKLRGTYKHRIGLNYRIGLDRTRFSLLWSVFLRYFILYAQLEEVYSIQNYFYLTPSFQYKKKTDQT